MHLDQVCLKKSQVVLIGSPLLIGQLYSAWVLGKILSHNNYSDKHYIIPKYDT